ncbi:hypothetical protein JCM21900_004650 [Sporobolomyces salmonicolor]
MQSQRGKSVLASPSGGSQFLVGGGAELRLYDCEDPTSSRFNTLSVVSELPGLRAFAWSPHVGYPLVAAGLTTGRVLLLRLDAAGSSGRTPSGAAAVQINVRHSRPCNVVAFSPDQPGLLAVGLEKGRGESLLVYDVTQSTRVFDPTTSATPLARTFSLQRESSQTGRGRAHSPAAAASSSSLEPHPLLSFGSSEVVTSAAFLASSSGTSPSSTSPLLVAAMAGKWLRVYDLRSPPSTVTTWGTRSVYGIAANPTHGQQFVSHGDDGIVRLWDLRKPMDSLLSFSEAEAGSVPARSRSSHVVKPLAELSWCPGRRGVLATLEKDAAIVRVWNLVEGPGPKLVDNMGEVEASLAELGVGERRPPQRDEYGAQAGQAALRMPVVLDDRRTRPFQQSLTSFAFASSSTPSSPLRIIGLSRDNANPGSSGHRLEIVDLPPPPRFAFVERGLLTTSSSDSNRFQVFSVPVDRHAGMDEPDLPEPGLAGSTQPLSTPSSQPFSNPFERGRALSFTLGPVDRNATPRPGGLLQRMSIGVDGDLPGETAAHGAGISALASDMSFVLRQRVDCGYGSDALHNAGMSESSIAEFWRWVARAQALSSNACFADYDFRFRGVLRILHGFPSGSGASGQSSLRTDRLPRTTPRTIHSDSTRSLRRADDSHLKTAAYDSACAQLVSRRKLEHIFAISSSNFAAQRKLALQTCGAEWEEAWEAVCSRFEKQGDYEAAARQAFFSGQLEKSMNYLRQCIDKDLRMLAPIVAAYLAQRESLTGSESNYAELCQSLALSSETPWVRALFAFLASGGEWRELVNEIGLPLRERVAVALRFLSDSELVSFLKELDKESLSYGDLEAVILYGLRNDGLTLLSNFVDRTADVQTAALAYSFVSPGLIRSDLRVKRWIETYRTQLDSLQLYAERAMFDAARGRRARAAMEQSRLAGRLGEANEVAAALRRAAPPQIVVRCAFCSTNVAPSKGVHDSGRSAAGPTGVKSSFCPSCSKQLPACSICLTRPSVHSFEADGPSTLCWCQKCRHGGHVDHILAWFETSEVCAVAECECKCRGDGR